MKLAVFFPGIGYNVERPLLYYARKITQKYGFEEICVNYGGFEDNVKNDDEKKARSYQSALAQAKEILKDVDFNKYEEIIFVGKSIGTGIATAIAEIKNITPRYILYTPLESTLKAEYKEAIAFHGSSDSWGDSYEIRRICDEKNIDLRIIARANHSLETGLVNEDARNLTLIMQATEEFVARTSNPNLKQALNPYMGGNEYVPDGEPYVFGDRVYVYGSHDMFNGNVYCMLDYVTWSAPINDLGNWRYEGVIYKIDQDPDNTDSSGKLYAPDVSKGPDGRYYLYYAINNQNHISVAVCDHPAGHFEFYGFVHYKDGTRLGDKESDEMQFDPGVLYEDGKVYLYTGFCPADMKERHGAMLTVLDKDMVTIVEEPKFVVPSAQHSTGTGYEGHEFFEAPSIRKIEGKYAFIYSSIKFHELCYAIADDPHGPFVYKGVIISNGDLHIDSYKDADKCTYLCANNHGSVEKIGDDYYIFYHRHTNGTNYSRQACFEKLKVHEDATIEQAMMTSNGGLSPLKAEGTYPSYIACNLFIKDVDTVYIPWSGWMSDRYAKITQDGRDGEVAPAYITNMTRGTVAGFKSFDFKKVKKIGLNTLGYGTGDMEIRTSIDGPVLGKISVNSENVWTYNEADVSIEDGIHDLYITYNGDGWSSIRDFTFVL